MEDNNENFAQSSAETENTNDNYRESDAFNDKGYYDSYDYMKDAENVDTKYEPCTAARVLLVLMAIFLNVLGAVIGIIVGAVYMGKSAQGYKSYGKMLLIISIVFLVLDLLFWISLASFAGQLFSMFMFY
ncbi:MAG: hypothetical protein PUD43_04955 [Clostridia bacterium]|nr:hypothetical protein [Clostridia bacterium]